MAEVRYEVVDQVATLTLARPEKRNALNRSMLSALRSRTREAGADRAVRVLLLAADGPVFCAGADLSGGVADDSESFAGEAAHELAALLGEWMDFLKPIVARVQGPVLGGGNGLLAAADVVVATSAATFSLREVRVGVAPAVIAVPLLQRIAPGSLRDLMLTGRSVDVAEACDIGLVHRVADDVDLDTSVQHVIAELLKGGPRSQAATKHLLQRLAGSGRDEAFALAVEVSVACFSSEEAQEGIAAFREKRSPSW